MSQHSHLRRRLAFLTVILLIVAASRIVQLKNLDMDYDDAWSIWQTFGSPAEIIRWTPYDWPPLYFLSVGAWKEVAGIDPLVLRYFSVLVFMLGVPCLYRAARRMWGKRAGLLSILAYSAIGYVMYLSLFLRSYGLLLSLMALALWLMVRYFERPSWRRGVLLAVCLISMFYYHYTSLFAFAMLGLYTLFAYPRRLWRWWLPGLILTLATVPYILSKWSVFTGRTNINRLIELPPLLTAIGKLAQTIAGPTLIWLLILVGVAAVLLFVRRTFQPRAVALALWIASPVLLYLLQSKLGIFQDPRYMWGVLPGIALWLGWGLSRLPRRGTQIVAISLIGCMFFPHLMDQYQPVTPFGANFIQLHQDWRSGDVILIDPRCNRDCGAIEAWDYFTRVYFPGGLTFVSRPDGFRRVWYVAKDWDEDPATVQALNNGYVPGVFFGPPAFLMRLYEAPPDKEGILFENGMRFHGVEIPDSPTPFGVVYRAGQTIHLRLWWSVDKPPVADYSLSLRLLVNKAPAIQLDGPPQVTGAPQATSQWTPGRYYIEDREITLPYPIDKGSYTFYLTVYQWWDQKRIAAPGVNQEDLLAIQTINVQSWN